MPFIKYSDGHIDGVYNDKEDAKKEFEKVSSDEPKKEEKKEEEEPNE